MRPLPSPCSVHPDLVCVSPHRVCIDPRPLKPAGPPVQLCSAVMCCVVVNWTGPVRTVQHTHFNTHSHHSDHSSPTHSHPLTHPPMGSQEFSSPLQSAHFVTCGSVLSSSLITDCSQITGPDSRGLLEGSGPRLRF